MMEMITKLFRKNREIVMYLIFGVLTTVVNWIVYSLTVNTVSMTVANVLAWFCAVIFAFFTNKLFVFESRSWKLSKVVKEIVSFFGSRLATGLVEIFGPTLLFSIGLNQSLFGVKGFLAKVIISVGVIILNYVFSKLIVFRKDKKRQ